MNGVGQWKEDNRGLREAGGERRERVYVFGVACEDDAVKAIEYAREAVVSGLDLSFEQRLHLEMDLYALLQTTADRAEGLRSFREKRAPKFEGR